MSTAVHPVETLEERPSRTLGQISERDFRVCENCGDPAMTHPRFELNTRLFTERAFVFCCACLHQAIAGEKPKAARRKFKFEFGTQVWSCSECGQARKWGDSQPWDRWIHPALNCTGCDAVTRHVFLRVEGY